MKNSREKFFKKVLCTKTNTKLVNKEKKLYSLFLHEDLYPVILQKEPYFVFTETSTKKYKKESFLSIKRIIFFLRSNKFVDLKQVFGDKKAEISFRIILESIAFFLLCGQEQKDLFNKFFFTTNHLSISIHKPLEYIERQWQYDSFGFQGHIFSFFHAEVLLRILRRKFQDISFLHLLRLFLYSDMYALNNTFKETPFNKIRNILWNIYVLEIDKFFVSQHKYSYTFDKGNYATSNESVSCLQKMKEWKYFVEKQHSQDIFCKNLDILFLSDKRRKISFLVQCSTYKYLRTNTSWFLLFQKERPWNFLIKKRIMHFFAHRLGYVIQTNIISPTLMPLRYSYAEYLVRRKKFSYFLLAYMLQFNKKQNFIRINTKSFFLTSYFVKNVIYFLNPLYLIIILLEKHNFCTSSGYPRRKSGWVTLTDSNIIERFNQVRDVLFLFYSGCNNSKALSRIQYILYYSCAKTLACKHKTNLRQIFRIFHKNLTNKDVFFSTNHSKTFRLRFLYKNQKKIRVWNFHLIQIHSLILSLEYFSNFPSSFLSK